jgi:hypothetical protein
MKESSSSVSNHSAREASPLVRFSGGAGLVCASAILVAVFVAVAWSPSHVAALGAGTVALGSGVWWLLGTGAARRARGSDQGSRERTRRGVDALASIALLAALLAVANALGARYKRTFDWTGNSINSLSPQTGRVLGALKSPVTLSYIFFGGSGQGAPRPDDLALLRAYEEASPRVRVQRIDAALEPARVQALRLLAFDGTRPSLLVSQEHAGGKEDRREVTSLDEASISSALLGLSAPARSLYVLTGHGEALASGREFNRLARDLASQNARLSPLSLALSGAKVPKGASGVLIVAPRSDLSPSELSALLGYFESGGRLVLWMESSEVWSPKSRWSQLLGKLGLQTRAGSVFDLEQYAFDSPQNVRGALRDPVLGDATRHPVLRGVDGDVILFGSVPLQLSDAPVARQVQSLFVSSDGSFARAFSASSPRNAAPPQAGEARGPFVLAAATERANRARALVVADAFFASDRGSTAFGNRSFALSGINWASGDELLVSIPPRARVTNTLSMPDDAQRLSRLLSLVALPGAFLLLGAWTWWKRR